MFNAHREQSDALAFLRKESLDLFNRLHSIAEDVSFVNQVHAAYPDIPILPNLRCGAWYTDPAIATDCPAYFKSTDGHFSNWSFNLRRSNLHLLPLAAARGGKGYPPPPYCTQRP
ncbi:initiator tRNA phosphoribosyl transferase-domain-containing protein [Mycena polygramma]|nr:initiator tRNA phosphoribosyl transferase-domain-containing protein [Mycena polygramma]